MFNYILSYTKMIMMSIIIMFAEIKINNNSNQDLLLYLFSLKIDTSPHLRFTLHP